MNTYDRMPTASTTPAIRNALPNDCVSPTTNPVTAGATTPIMLLAKFMMPPMVPVPPFGAISEGIDQPTGAAADSPLRATEIHEIAHTGLVVWVAPNTARPTSMPQISTVLRTRDSFMPRATR